MTADEKQNTHIEKLPQRGFIYDTINKIIDTIRGLARKVDLLHGDIDLETLDTYIKNNAEKLKEHDKKLEDLSNKIKINDTNITTNTSKISAIETNLNNISNQIQTINTTLTSLEERIHTLEQKRSFSKAFNESYD